MDETGDAEVVDVGRTDAPWGKDLLVQAIRYRSGMRIARLRIREGRRFTVLDLDEATLPIRLLPTPPTCRMLPGSGVKLCVGKVR